MFPPKILAIFLINGILLGTSCFLVPKMLAEPIAIGDEHTSNFPEIADTSLCSIFTPSPDSLHESTATAIASPTPEAEIENSFVSHSACTDQSRTETPSSAIAQENSQQSPSPPDSPSPSGEEFAPQAENPAWRFSITQLEYLFWSRLVG